LVLLLPLLYSLGYFFRCQVSWLVPPPTGVPARYVAQANAPATGRYVMIRHYPHDWEAGIFLPAARLESWWRRNQVMSRSP
jgi:hypothetical protein